MVLRASSVEIVGRLGGHRTIPSCDPHLFLDLGRLRVIQVFLPHGGHRSKLIEVYAWRPVEGAGTASRQGDEPSRVDIAVGLCPAEEGQPVQRLEAQLRAPRADDDRPRTESESADVGLDSETAKHWTHVVIVPTATTRTTSSSCSMLAISVNAFRAADSDAHCSKIRHSPAI